MHMDGTDQIAIHSSPDTQTYGPISLDLAELKIYCLKDKRLVRMNYDGSFKENIKNINGNVNSLVVDGSWFYISYSNETLEICNKMSKNDCYNVKTPGLSTTDMVLYDSEAQTKGS